MTVKILPNEWLSAISISSGNNKSFGPITMPEFQLALKNVIRGRIVTATDKWIKENNFFATFPPEMIFSDEQSGIPLINYLCAYNPGAREFIDKYPSFYLWISG